MVSIATTAASAAITNPAGRFAGRVKVRTSGLIPSTKAAPLAATWAKAFICYLSLSVGKDTLLKTWQTPESFRPQPLLANPIVADQVQPYHQRIGHVPRATIEFRAVENVPCLTRSVLSAGIF